MSLIINLPAALTAKQYTLEELIGRGETGFVHNGVLFLIVKNFVISLQSGVVFTNNDCNNSCLFHVDYFCDVTINATKYL